MNNVSWKECQFVIIDVEGNGQTPQEIIELSIVPVFCEQISKPYTWLIRPKMRVTERATQIHGITNRELQHCCSSEEVRHEIRGVLGKNIVVGHNVSVDTRLIRSQFGEWEPLAIIDTLKLAKYVHPELSSYSLDSLITIYGLDIIPSMRHRASGDAQVTAQLFLALVSKLKDDSQRDLLSLSQIAGSVDDPFLKNQQGSLF
ncbi:3'-5' exonuclease [Aliivibrio fischeri]|uniref:3'-5' exonuclease n=1 Tax=Aliivibrio fischeri TaxID=668 RepID=UPI00107EC29F|nr:3'-5' exonuclease [Aliivibrio fischeri]TGA73268.1 3'-5' exonuclease [Aliivibrio fischeri]